MAVKKRVGKRIFLCQAGNISTEGMLIAKVADESPSFLEKCFLEFSLPGSKVVIGARGRVVRQNIRGRYHLMAIRFAAIAPSHRRMIQSYISSPPTVSAAPTFWQAA
jgi:hypothetical protein